MVTSNQFLFGLLVPAVIAGVLALIGWLISGGRLSWGATVGLATAMGIGYRPLTGHWPPFPPISSTDWILFGAFALGVVGLVEQKTIWLVRAMMMLAMTTTLMWLVLRPLTLSPMILAGFIGVAGIWWASSEAIASRRPRTGGPILLGLISTGSALLLMLCGNQSLGFQAAVMAAVFAVYFIIALILKKSPVAGGPVLICVPLLTALIGYGYFSLDPHVMTKTELSLLAISPLLAWIVEIRPLGKLKAWQRELLRAALIGAPIAIAVILAAIQFKKDTAGMEM